MPQYLIIARDGKDSEALTRRLAARPAHFEMARALKAAGHFIIGGAMLDAVEQMTGSMMVVAFDTEEQLREWLEKEPYITGKVWQEIDIQPFRTAGV